MFGHLKEQYILYKKVKILKCRLGLRDYKKQGMTLVPPSGGAKSLHHRESNT